MAAIKRAPRADPPEACAAWRGAWERVDDDVRGRKSARVRHGSSGTTCELGNLECAYRIHVFRATSSLSLSLSGRGGAYAQQGTGGGSGSPRYKLIVRRPYEELGVRGCCDCADWV